jgi:hypothetical protein
MPTAYVCPRYDAATIRSHRAISRVEVRSAAGVFLERIYPDGGSVSANYGAAERRSCSLNVPALPGLSPDVFTDLLHPLSGNELHLFKGIRFDDGTEEFCPLGVLPITDATPSRGSGGPALSVTGKDRCERITSVPQVYPLPYVGGLLHEVIAQVLQAYWPDVPLGLGEVTEVVNSGVIASMGDGWREAQKLAADNGYDLAFDADGVCRMRPIPDPALQTPLYDYSDGGARVLTRLDRTISRTDVRTGVVVRVQNPANGEVYTGQAWDLNPASPTYADGPLGRRPESYDAPSIGSDAAAQASAEARLRLLGGRSDGYQISLVPNAALDVADVVQLPVNGRVVPVFLEQLTTPITAIGEVSATCRTTLPLTAA